MKKNITETAIWAADSTIEVFSDVLSPETMADDDTKWRMFEFAMDSFINVRDGWNAEEIQSAMEIVKDRFDAAYANESVTKYE